MAASLPPPPRTHAEIHVNALTLEIEPGSIFRLAPAADRRNAEGGRQICAEVERTAFN